jgi:dienelactone hydrolase
MTGWLTGTVAADTGGVRFAAATPVMALVLVLLGGCAGHRPPPDPGPVPTDRPGALCLTGTERSGVVRFRSPNGASLGGVVIGAGRTGVVLVQGSTGDLCVWMPYARRLAGLGYQVLAFDLNGLGSSGASPGNPGDARFDQDVMGAATLLRSRGASTVLLIGASLGGSAVLVAAAELSPPATGVIDIAGGDPVSKLDTDAAARRLRIPVLYLVGAGDNHVDQAHLRAVYAATVATDRRLDVIADSYAHGVNLLDPQMEPQAPAARQIVEGFLAAHAGR